jgi:hypothetical protein
MIQNAKRMLGNEDGFALVAAILISVILILIGVYTLWTSNAEVRVVRNEADLTLEFYNAEGGAVDALENYNRAPTQWLTDAFLLAGPTAAGNIVTSYDTNGKAVAMVEVRCIENAGISIPGLSAAANHLPLQNHVGPPPSGAGFSLKYFEARNYGLTATSTTGNTQIQIGAWKVFNKY